VPARVAQRPGARLAWAGLCVGAWGGRASLPPAALRPYARLGVGLRLVRPILAAGRRLAREAPPTERNQQR